MTRGRLYAYFTGAVVVAAFLGFIFGWYQAYPAQHSRDRAMLRLRLSEARARTLDTRVALARSNYGDARGHLNEAVRLLEAFKSADQDKLPPTEATRIDQALTALHEAVPMMPLPQASGAPPSAAASRVEQATNLLGEVYRATPEP